MPKTIVITGTATGMGRATVGKFAAEGWNVVATVRKEPDLKAHAGLRCEEGNRNEDHGQWRGCRG